MSIGSIHECRLTKDPAEPAGIGVGSRMHAEPRYKTGNHYSTRVKFNMASLNKKLSLKKQDKSYNTDIHKYCQVYERARAKIIYI